MKKNITIVILSVLFAQGQSVCADHLVEATNLEKLEKLEKKQVFQQQNSVETDNTLKKRLEQQLEERYSYHRNALRSFAIEIESLDKRLFSIVASLIASGKGWFDDQGTLEMAHDAHNDPEGLAYDEVQDEMDVVREKIFKENSKFHEWLFAFLKKESSK